MKMTAVNSVFDVGLRRSRALRRRSAITGSGINLNAAHTSAELLNSYSAVIFEFAYRIDCERPEMVNSSRAL